jgi:hypothetical protein
MVDKLEVRVRYFELFMFLNHELIPQLFAEKMDYIKRWGHMNSDDFGVNLRIDPIDNPVAVLELVYSYDLGGSLNISFAYENAALEFFGEDLFVKLVQGIRAQLGFAPVFMFHQDGQMDVKLAWTVYRMGKEIKHSPIPGSTKTLGSFLTKLNIS